MQKVMQGVATSKEVEEFGKLWQKRVEKILCEHNMDEMHYYFKDCYSADHMIWIGADKSCKIWTRKDTYAFVPACSHPMNVVEKDALDFLKSILEKEEEDVERYRHIDILKDSIDKLRDIEGCDRCGGTGEEVVAYTLEDRYPLIGDCEECNGTGVISALHNAVFAMQDKIIYIKKGGKIV